MSEPGKAKPEADMAETADSPLLRGAKAVRSVFSVIDWLAPLVALLVLCTVVATARPVFLRPENLLNIVNQQSFVGLLALGMTFVIITGGIDLSVASLLAFSGALGIWVMNTVIDAETMIQAMEQARALGYPRMPYTQFRISLANWFQSAGLAGSEKWGVVLGVAATLLCGLLGGLVNGLIIAKGRVAPFVATLGGLAAYRSLAYVVADSGELRSTSESLYPSFGGTAFHLPWLRDLYGKPIGVSWPTVVFVVAAMVLIVVLWRTRYGRHAVAVGSNEQAAAYSAIRVARVRIFTYALLGGLVGLAALLKGSQLESVSSGGTAMMWELDAIAAVVIGGTRMSGGRGSIVGTVVGLLMLGVIRNMMTLFNIPASLNGLVMGAVIVLAVLLQRSKKTA